MDHFEKRQCDRLINIQEHTGNAINELRRLMLLPGAKMLTN
jgi:ribosomal protein S10